MNRALVEHAHRGWVDRHDDVVIRVRWIRKGRWEYEVEQIGRMGTFGFPKIAGAARWRWLAIAVASRHFDNRGENNHE
jgi:hypothetical protein